LRPLSTIAHSVADSLPEGRSLPADPRCVLGVQSSFSGQVWRYRCTDERAILGLSQHYGLSEPLARLLAGRNVTAAQVETYLDPRLQSQLPDPSLFADMDPGAARLAEAIEGGEKIAVFGDYDVDGATSSALLSRYLRHLGVPFTVYIPDRQKEGYGPNVPAFEQLVGSGARLLVTVDCGTQSFEPIDRAKALGADVIVLDHHAPGPELPRAFALVNPNRHDDLSGCGQLAAVGVTFIMLVALNRELRRRGWFQRKGVLEPNLLSLLDLVALGTVCDVVPLTGVNRAFVAQGLKILRRGQNVGLAALCEVAQLTRQPGVYELGFLLGPRLNAGGRIGNAHLGVRLLTATSKQSAWQIAIELDRLNAERRQIEAEMLAQAVNLAEQQLETDPDMPVIAVDHRDWHPGIIGIVASRLKDRFHRPAMVIGFGEDDTGHTIGKGSGRSIPGVDLGAAVLAAKAAGLLVNGGGHAMAAGLTVKPEKIESLSAFLAEFLKQSVKDNFQRVLKIDALIGAQACSAELLEAFERAAPFGPGNAEPVVALPNVLVSYCDLVGVKCTLKDPVSAKTVHAIAFRAYDTPLGDGLFRQDGPIHVAGKVRRDDWRGGQAVQLVIDDAARAAND